MSLIPKRPAVGASVIQHKNFYPPKYQGPTLYLNANPDLAVFEDCEGNRIALHSKD